MGALEYEMLIRRVNACGRTNANGANADIYRAMERAHRNLTDPLWVKSEEAKKFEYAKAFGSVHQYVVNAIDYGAGLLRHQMLQADREKINEILKALVGDQAYSKSLLDNCIKEADAVFYKYGLMPG